MKIIIDECVPSIVKKQLPEREIVTVQEMGWAGIKTVNCCGLLQLTSTSSLPPTKIYATSKTSQRSISP